MCTLHCWNELQEKQWATDSHAIMFQTRGHDHSVTEAQKKTTKNIRYFLNSRNPRAYHTEWSYYELEIGFNWENGMRRAAMQAAAATPSSTAVRPV